MSFMDRFSLVVIVAAVLYFGLHIAVYLTK
jgi:hypothetical protein